MSVHTRTQAFLYTLVKHSHIFQCPLSLPPHLTSLCLLFYFSPLHTRAHTWLRALKKQMCQRQNSQTQNSWKQHISSWQIFVNFQHGWCSHLSPVPLCFELSPASPELTLVQMSLVNRLFPHTLSCRIDAQLPGNADAGPALIAHSSRRCWKLKTISPHLPPS